MILSNLVLGYYGLNTALGCNATRSFQCWAQVVCQTQRSRLVLKSSLRASSFRCVRPSSDMSCQIPKNDSQVTQNRPGVMNLNPKTRHCKTPECGQPFRLGLVRDISQPLAAALTWEPLSRLSSGSRGASPTHSPATETISLLARSPRCYS